LEVFVEVFSVNYVSFGCLLQMDAGAARAKVAKLGLAAVLAYGLLDSVTYTIAFTLAFLGYEKSTGLNPARNLKSLLGVSFALGTDLPLLKEGLKSPSRFGSSKPLYFRTA
jgi:hypothetical protein